MSGSVSLRHQSQPFSSVSISLDQQFAAAGCGAHVSVIALSKSGAKEHATIQLKSTGRFTVTDTEFSPLSNGVIASSGTNGTIAVFNFHTGQETGRSRYSCLWDSGEKSRSVNKVTWHPTDSSVLLSSGMDGLVKIYDLRFKNECRGIFDPRSEATRDVAFNPFDPTQFAALSENGALSLWDSRNMDAPVLKISAHTMFGLSLAWNPSKRGILATGSRDKTVKVWDLRATRDTTAVESVTTAASAATVSEAVLKSEKESALSKEKDLPTHVIHTPASVGRVRWRRGDRFRHQLATTSLSTESASGEIHIWDIGMPNTPACVLRGHTEICTDFAWLDTPTESTSSGKEAGSGSTQTDKRATWSINENYKESSRRLLEDSQKYDVLEVPKTAPTTQSFLGVHQHVLSVGKDGQMLVQDIRCGFFPRQHMSASVAAISSTGHVAFQRGTVVRDDPIGLIASRDTANAPGWYKDRRDCFGMRVPGEAIPGSEEEKAPLPTGKRGKKGNKGGARGERGDKDTSAKDGTKINRGMKDVFVPVSVSSSSHIDETGRIFVGLTNIHDLGSARDIRLSLHDRRGAEGGVFDPAVISLLARSYAVGHNNDIGDVTAAESALAACEHNLQITTNAGLHCRTALWSTAHCVLSSLRLPSLSSDCSDSQLPMVLPFGLEILGELLMELLEGGDCQHFVLLAEILKHARVLDEACAICDISTMQRREVYLAYFELLSQMRLFSCVVSFMKDSDDDYISRVSRHGTTMHTACAKCGKELPEGKPWCKKCLHFAAICSLCQQPVRGLMHWCPICGHGSHLECSKIWFRDHNSCMSGCGHNCCDPNGAGRESFLLNVADAKGELLQNT